MLNFNLKITSRLTGLSPRQLDYWDKTHFIKPSIASGSGKGSIRLYSFVDLVQLRVAKVLRDKGITLQRMRKALEYLRKRSPDIEHPLATLRFLTDGETIFVLTDNRDVLVDTLKEGQLVLSIAIGDLVKELEGKVISLAKERKYTVVVNKIKYEVILEPDLEDGGYHVFCPFLPGCRSQGETVTEALSMIKDAISLWIETSRRLEKAKVLEV